MSTTTSSIQLTQLDSRFKSVWRRSQQLHLIAGILACARWAILLFLVAFAVDWMTNIPAVGRGFLLVVLLVFVVYKSWQCGWRKLRAFDATRTALQLEKHYGGLESLLVSAVQLRHPAVVAGASASLRDRTFHLAEEAASTLHPKETVPYGRLQRPALGALLLAGLIVIFALVNSHFLKAGLSRIFAPWLAVEYPTFTQLDLGDGDLVVKEGASARIHGRVLGVVPDEAKLFLRTGEGPPREVVLEIVDGACEYNIASASRDFTYQIKAGDALSPWYTVGVIPAPRVEQVRLKLEYPAYLDRSAETVEALTLTVPEGTQVNWQLQLDRPISEAVFLRDGEEPLQLQVSEGGRQVKFSALASDSRGYSFKWVEKERGYSFNSPRYHLQVASDQPPQVELTSPATNLFAMLGRPLDLVARVHDDHAIAATKVIYRVNHRNDETVVLSSPIRTGAGEQAIDWDYRTVLADLKVGDTVSFAVEVSDKYSGLQGPHKARSETKRITILSKEEYLEQIGRKIARLLSLVRTTYRQERAATELVLNLNPEDDSFRQTCQMEAIRQEMMRSQLKEIASEVQLLLADLAANKVSDAAEGESLEKVRLALLDIAESHIAEAASLLRVQSDAAVDTQESVAPHTAARAINSAARELGSLVLLRDIDSAQEVYAREARLLAQLQANLRWRTIVDKSVIHAPELAKQQNELARWTDRLISDLQNGMCYGKRPLAVLRLTRSVKELRDTPAAKRMLEAGEMIRQGKADQAQAIQAELVRTLLNAEFSVRFSGAYSTLTQTRREIDALIQAQTQLRERIAAKQTDLTDPQRPSLVKAQSALRKRLLTMLLPSVPAPRAQLFDESPPQTPPVQDLLADADRGMHGALTQLAGGKHDEAVSEQRKVEIALAALATIVDRWSVELGVQSQGLSTLVAATSERLSRIESYESRTIGLLEQTDTVAAERKNVESLAGVQMILVDELAGFRQELIKQNQAEPDPDLPPVLNGLERAERALNAAVQSLRSNKAEQAIEHQEQAADALAAAFDVVKTQTERLGKLQDLLLFQRSVGFANSYMGDIVAEQRDLLAATKASEPKDLSPLMPQFGNMRECLVEVAPLLDLVAARLDVGTPLAFARTDFEDAMASLKSGDKLDAIDAQDVAAESLASVQLLVQDIHHQTGYVAEIVSLLHDSVAEAVLLQFEQQALKEQASADAPSDLTKLAEHQHALLQRAHAVSRGLVSATGMQQFDESVKPMAEALARLKANDAKGATEQMELAIEAFKANSESLIAVITMLHGLPSIEITTRSAPELVRLVDVLAVASSHKRIFRTTHASDTQDIKALAERELILVTRCKELAKQGEPHAMLDAASRHLADAASAFSSNDREALRASQRAADEKLRHFIVEQALILETAVPPAVASDAPASDGPGGDKESEFSAGFINDFVSGEMPKDKRSGWNVLGDRNRAALNQNFARELPLEYRGILKNYYERVAE